LKAVSHWPLAISFFSFMASSGGAGDREFKEFSDAPFLKFPKLSKFTIIFKNNLSTRKVV
jgi:hypothetical protein